MLPHLFAQQGNLPSLDGLMPLPTSGTAESWPLGESTDASLATGGAAQAFRALDRDQLTLESEQGVLRELDPMPRQLGLLPDPPPWEAEGPEPSVPSKSRLSKRRQKLGISPGQASLF